MKDITQKHNATPKQLDINGKVIPLGIGHMGTRDFKKKWGGFIKKGCRTESTIKTSYLLKHISELCFIQQNHVNQIGLHVHRDLKMGDRSTFVAHLLKQIKDFVMK